MTDWIILTTASSQTLNLAASLAEAGMVTWSPIEVREVRKGKRRDITEREMPILPGYVFAGAKHLDELLALSRSPALNYQIWDTALRRMVTKGYPHFSVLRLHGQFRPQSNHSLEPLRELETSLRELTERRREQVKHKGPAPKFTAGQTVQVDSGGFQGLALKVAEDNQGKIVKLIHPDWMWTVEISAWKLRDVQLSQALPEQDVPIRTAA